MYDFSLLYKNIINFFDVFMKNNIKFGRVSKNTGFYLRQITVIWQGGVNYVVYFGIYIITIHTLG